MTRRHRGYVATTPTAYESVRPRAVYRYPDGEHRRRHDRRVRRGHGQRRGRTGDRLHGCLQHDGLGHSDDPGRREPGEIAITPVDEQIFGGTKAVTLSLTTEMMGGGSAGYQLGDDASDTVSIEENDVAPVVTIVATSPTAYESGEVQGVTVTLHG